MTRDLLKETKDSKCTWPGSRALTGVGAGLLEWGVMSPSEAVYVCLLVFNQSGDGLASFSGAYRTRKSFG